MFPHPHILIVDDDEAIRFVIRLALEDVGYTIEEAPDGRNALQQIHLSTIPLVVITDHRMPHLDGPGLLKELAAEPDLSERHQVIYCTANSEHITPPVQALLDHLHAPTLSKPFDIDTLVQLVQRTIAQIEYRQLTAALVQTITVLGETAKQERPRPSARSDTEQLDEHAGPDMEQSG